jgi:aspartate aminotransferase, mitochondrial
MERSAGASNNDLPLTVLQISVTQSISGTGALRIGGAFLARHNPNAKIIYLPSPSWGNHTPIFRDSGLEVRTYSYFNKETVGLDFDGLIADLKVRLFSYSLEPAAYSS